MIGAAFAMSPYRSPLETYVPEEEPPFDHVAHRVLAWLGGGFHLLGSLGLFAGIWMLALTGTSILVHAVGASQSALSLAPFVSVVVTVIVLVLAHGARIVGTDVWAGRQLVRCRVACVLAIGVGGPLGLVVGLAGLVVLVIPRFRRLFTS